MEQSLEDRKTFYQILTRKIIVLILVVSFLPMMLTTGIFFYRFNLAYTEKVQAHISELVQKHSQNIDTFLSEKLGNIRFIAQHFNSTQQAPKMFLQNLVLILRTKAFGTKDLMRQKSFWKKPRSSLKN